LAHYDGTQSVNGLSLYRFVGTVPPVRIGAVSLPGTVLGLKDPAIIKADEYYANPREVTLVDPVTGAPVQGTSHLHITLRAPGATADRIVALDVELASDPDTIAAPSRRANEQGSRLAFVTTTGPVGALGLGSAAVVIGAFSQVRARRRPPRSGLRPATEV